MGKEGGGLRGQGRCAGSLRHYCELTRGINGRNGQRGRREEGDGWESGVRWSVGNRVGERSTSQSLCGSVTACESFSAGKRAGLVGGLIGLPGLGWPNSLFFVP